MNFTLWILLLGALAGGAYYFRGKLGNRKRKKSRTQLEAEKRVARAEADRRDIQNLVSKLSGGSSDTAPPAEPRTATSAPGPSGGAEQRPRVRHSSQPSHGYDPDLPVPPEPPARR